MHFISQIRYNPSTGADDFYYRIKESVRDLTGRVHSYVLLNVGFMTPRLKPGQVRDIAICLNWLSEHRGEQDLFGDAMSRFDEIVRSRAMEYWQQMASLGTVDRARKIIEESRPKAERLVDVDTMEHTDAREVGAEWICLQAIRELEIDRFLEQEGWSEIQINTALAQLITRTVYSPSELKSLDIMRENSAVCELLTGSQEWHPGFHATYGVAPALYELKDKLEDHLCRRTDSLFNVTNRIALFDLTIFTLRVARRGARRRVTDVRRRSAPTASCWCWPCASTRRASSATRASLRVTPPTLTHCPPWWTRWPQDAACPSRRSNACSSALTRA